MNYEDILESCNESKWQDLDKILKSFIQNNADQPEGYVFAAHTLIRQGNTHISRWLLDKAQSLQQDNVFARIEDICLDFYNAQFDKAHKKFNPSLLKDLPYSHPIYLIGGYLSCLYNNKELYESTFKNHINLYNLKDADKIIENYLNSEEIIHNIDTSWNIIPDLLKYLDNGDKLLACIIARYNELFFSLEADTFFALGLFNLHAGFFDNSANNFSESIFRKTNYEKEALIYQFYLFCYQQKFNEAITLALHIDKNGDLDIDGQGLLLEVMYRVGISKDKIKERLANLDQKLDIQDQDNSYIKVIRFRLEFLDKKIEKTDLIDIIQEYVCKNACHVNYLYFYAELMKDININESEKYAKKALSFNLLHPDTKEWNKYIEIKSINFEYAGLFIPKEHEGGALPTQTQMELLHILFLTTKDELITYWNRFAETHSIYSLEAGAYRLLPFIYKKLISTNQNEQILEIDLLKGIWKKNYFENALRIKNILDFIETLERCGIQVILLKGLANALSLYGDLGARPMADIDILIDKSKIGFVHNFLISRGWSVQADSIPTESRLRYQYASTYKHPKNGTLDIHWCPCDDFHCDYYDPNDINDLEKIKFLERQWLILSPTINLLCTILHGVEWNHLSPVRWISDSLLILQKFGDNIDWNKIFKLATKYLCIKPLIIGLQFLSKFDQEFTKNLPEELLKILENNYENDILIKIRMNPKNMILNFEEAYTVLKHYRYRFNFSDQDIIFICGGDDHEKIKEQCKTHNIRWLPYFDRDLMIESLLPNEKPELLYGVDANLSCLFKYTKGIN